MNEAIVAINDLIDEHNETSLYVKCPGCDLCHKIERVSKEQGLWFGENEFIKEARKRSQAVTKEQMLEQINAGLNNKEISQVFGISGKAVHKKIKNWFPDLDRRKPRKKSG